MVENTLVKHMVEWLESLTAGELQQHKEFICKELDRTESLELRRKMRFALHLTEEEQLARSAIENLQKSDTQNQLD